MPGYTRVGCHVFQTPAGEVIVMPGSGRTALEAGAISVIEPGDRVLVVVAGVVVVDTVAMSATAVMVVTAEPSRNTL